MNSHFRTVMIAALPLAVLFADSFAEDKPDSFKFDSVFTVSMSISKNESGEFGLLHGGILINDGRPEACFDLIRNRGEKPELVYLVLFQPEKLPKTLKVSMQVATNSDVSRGEFSIDLADRPLEIKYNYKLDSQVGKIAERTLKLAGRDWKSDGPRVFLADPTGDKLILKPVEVRLPTDLPLPSDDNLKNRMRQVIESISKESAEVRKFLGRENE